MNIPRSGPCSVKLDILERNVERLDILGENIELLGALDVAEHFAEVGARACTVGI